VRWIHGEIAGLPARVKQQAVRGLAGPDQCCCHAPVGPCPFPLGYRILEDRIGARMFAVVWQFEIADEWHQTFLPNRTGSVWDVLLDCCGALTLEALVYVFMRIFRPKKLARVE